jgi:hypothetical protein
MPFRCPQCLTSNSLDIDLSIELSPDRRSDEISLQVVTCCDCGFAGLAVYQESHRGELGTEDWNHIGYWVSPDAVHSVREAIQSCPDPYNARCTCRAHDSLSEQDIYGIWQGLLELKSGHTFLMRLFLG